MTVTAARSTLTEDEKLGMKTLPHEYAHFGYVNSIITLGNGFFHVGEIRTAMTHLVEMGREDCKCLYWDQTTNTPSTCRPEVDEGSRARLDARLDDEISVCFKNVKFGVKNEMGEPKPWYGMFRAFLSQLGKQGMPGMDVKWWYDKDSSDYLLREFNHRKKPHQALVTMFGGALKAFSCSINGSIDISGWTTPGEQAYTKYGHQNFGVWQGKLGDFLGMAEKLQLALNSSALVKMTQDIGHVNRGRGRPRGEIKLIHPELGMVAMRPEPIKYEAIHYCPEGTRVEDPETLIVNNEALRELRKTLAR